MFSERSILEVINLLDDYEENYFARLKKGGNWSIDYKKEFKCILKRKASTPTALEIWQICSHEDIASITFNLYNLLEYVRTEKRKLKKFFE